MENLKRLEAIWLLLASNTHLSEFVEEEDIVHFSRRTRGEGMAFLTETLPRLYKSLDRAFATGRLEAVVGFRRQAGCVYPRFLRKAWGYIFYKDGTLRSEAEIIPVGAVACLRQLSAAFYKLKLPYSDSKIKDVEEAFLKAELDLRNLELPDPSVGLLARARKILHRLLAGYDPKKITPKHGSGSSSCRTKSHERYDSFRYIRRLDRQFPYDKYFFYNHTHLCDNLDELLDSEEADPGARVVYVPKDSRGPRLISCEPREFMFIQQGLMSLLYRIVDAHPVIASQVGFTDQTRNQLMAQLGSQDQSFATLDLKEASDRVSWEIVATIFPQNWVNALGASRSMYTELPSGQKVDMVKFAPMGSAVCFPVEALTFWSITLAAILSDSAVNRLVRENFADIEVATSVFGDDIIVPTQFAEKVMTALESVGLLVNRDKSYWTGPFRESCGGDFFRGVNVTPVRVKTLPTDDMIGRHRTADLMNNLVCKYGYAGLGDPTRTLYESWFGPTAVSDRYDMSGPYPVKLHKGLTLYGPYRDVPRRYRWRWNSDLQRKEFRLPQEHPVTVEVTGDRWSRILRKELLKLHEREAHITALAKRCRYKYGWTCV